MFYTAPEGWSFQSTLPARGATTDGDAQAPLRKISIHAPRTGSDTHALGILRAAEISIHAPRTGSDLRIRFMCLEGGISIHATRTGSDDGFTDALRST